MIWIATLAWVPFAWAEDPPLVDPASPAHAASSAGLVADPGPISVVPSDADILSLFESKADNLVIGGHIYLRFDSSVGAAIDQRYAAFSSPNQLGLFADVRPTGSDHGGLRVYAAARVFHDFTVESGDADPYGYALEPTTVQLDEVWLKADVARRLYVTIGRQRIRWGSGRFWNPTDFLNSTTRPPLELYDDRPGVGLVKLHLPVGASNFYALADFEGASQPEDLIGAARAEIVAGPAEIALSGAVRGDERLQLGADVSAGLGPFDAHAEGAVRHGDPAPYWQGEMTSDTVPTREDRTSDWIPQIVTGLEVGIRYGNDDTLYVGGEYFWNDAGYPDTELHAWLLLKQDYIPLFVGRNYVSAYVHLPAPGRLNDAAFTASWIANLSDGSDLARLDVHWTVLKRLLLTAYGTAHFGNDGELNFALEVPAIEGVLDEAISVREPPFGIGVGAAVEF